MRSMAACRKSIAVDRKSIAVYKTSISARTNSIAAFKNIQRKLKRPIAARENLVMVDGTPIAAHI